MYAFAHNAFRDSFELLVPFKGHQNITILYHQVTHTSINCKPP